jgi:hypothetical protein
MVVYENFVELNLHTLFHKNILLQNEEFSFFFNLQKNDETTFFQTFHAHFRNPRLKLPYPAKFKK